MPVLVSDKVHFREGKITKNEEAFYIMVMIEGSIHEESIRILNEYAPYNRTSKHIWQKLIELKGKIQKSTIILEDVNTCLSG